MPGTLTIGDFSRATHLSVKTLRHYHQFGLLAPTEVDPQSGYRRYSTEQIPVAQVIRRFRDLDMPLGDIKAVLEAPGVSTRNAVIAGHLSRLQATLDRTQQATASLRALLDPPRVVDCAEVVNLSVRATPAMAISDVIETQSASPWCRGALAELRATASALGREPSGPAGGIFADGMFSDGRGQATMFLPVTASLRPTGRIRMETIPAVELATIVHLGPETDIDRAYGTLATYVCDHAVGVEGPIREYYLIDDASDPDPQHWRTQIGWPVFQTSTAAQPGTSAPPPIH
jgi:DNA-binding transcriptional MerR regulator